MNHSFTPAENTPRDRDDINNGDFWPVLNMAKFCELYAIDSDLTNDVVMHAMVMAAGATNRRLKGYQVKKTTEGIARLADDNGDKIDNKPVVVSWYLAAVYSEAKARLIKDSISTGRRKDAENEARTGEELADYYHARSTDAIAEIQGQSSTGVHLI